MAVPTALQSALRVRSIDVRGLPRLGGAAVVLGMAMLSSSCLSGPSADQSQESSIGVHRWLGPGLCCCRVMMTACMRTALPRFIIIAGSCWVRCGAVTHAQPISCRVTACGEKKKRQVLARASFALLTLLVRSLLLDQPISLLCHQTLSSDPRKQSRVHRTHSLSSLPRGPHSLTPPSPRPTSSRSATAPSPACSAPAAAPRAALRSCWSCLRAGRAGGLW